MNSFFGKVASALRSPVGRTLAILGAGLVLVGSTTEVRADDVDTAVTTAAAYWTAIKTIAIGVALFLIGRRLMKKI